MTYYPIARAVPSYYIATFKEVSVRSTEKLLIFAAKVADRKALSERLGIPTSDILEFVNTADLLRVKRLGVDYIRLLRQAGVLTVRELSYRNPSKLLRAIKDANAKHTIVDVLPSLSFVTSWIEQAKELPIVVSYR